MKTIPIDTWNAEMEIIEPYPVCFLSERKGLIEVTVFCGEPGIRTVFIRSRSAPRTFRLCQYGLN